MSTVVKDEEKKLADLLDEHTMDWQHTDEGWTNGLCYIRHYSLDVRSDTFGAVEIMTRDLEDRIFLGWISSVSFLDELLPQIPSIVEGDHE